MSFVKGVGAPIRTMHASGPHPVCHVIYLKENAVKKTALIASLVCGLASAASAQELFVNIHSGQAMAQGAGLVLAGQALEQKASVRVLLCDAAADIAVTGKEMPSLKPRNVTPQQMLQGLDRKSVV